MVEDVRPCGQFLCVVGLFLEIGVLVKVGDPEIKNSLIWNYFKDEFVLYDWILSAIPHGRKFPQADGKIDDDEKIPQVGGRLETGLRFYKEFTEIVYTVCRQFNICLLWSFTEYYYRYQM